jgi:molecular chaperone GrpE
MSEPIQPEIEATEATDLTPEAIDYELLYRRALADQENARKRMEEEKRQFATYAQAGMIEDLLPVIDNFYRATEHVPAEQKDGAWTQGILHIQRQLLDILEDLGLKEVAAKPGDAFDPSIHEGIGTAPGEEEDRIVEVKTKGYTLKDRLIRPASVIVSTK